MEKILLFAGGQVRFRHVTRPSARSILPDSSQLVETPEFLHKYSGRHAKLSCADPPDPLTGHKVKCGRTGNFSHLISDLRLPAAARIRPVDHGTNRALGEPCPMRVRRTPAGEDVMHQVCPGSRRSTDRTTTPLHRQFPPCIHGNNGEAGCGADLGRNATGGVRR